MGLHIVTIPLNPAVVTALIEYAMHGSYCCRKGLGEYFGLLIHGVNLVNGQRSVETQMVGIRQKRAKEVTSVIDMVRSRTMHGHGVDLDCA